MAAVVVLVAAIAVWWSTQAEEGAGEAASGKQAPPTSPQAQRAEPPPPQHPQAGAGETRDDGAREPGSEGRVAGDGGSAPPAADAEGEAAASAAVRGWLEQNAALAEKHVERFCAESKLVKRAPPGPAPTRARDASSFLTVRIDWEGGERPPGLLHLPEALRQRLLSYGAEWPQRITDADLQGVDFEWMTQLHQFDHWNLLAEGPLREDRTRDFYRAPIPNFTELYHWVKLRLAVALRTREYAQASADVHQLVALLRSIGAVIADMVAVQVLQLERRALEGVAPELVYSADELAHERRVGRSAMYFMQPGVKEAVMRKAMECNAHFKCSALAEGLGAHVTLAPFSDAKTLGAVQSMIEASGCDSELTRWIGSASARPPVEAQRAVVDPDGNALSRLLEGNTPP